jgi:hypothetical protein
MRFSWGPHSQVYIGCNRNAQLHMFGRILILDLCMDPGLENILTQIRIKLKYFVPQAKHEFIYLSRDE